MTGQQKEELQKVVLQLDDIAEKLIEATFEIKDVIGMKKMKKMKKMKG